MSSIFNSSCTRFPKLLKQLLCAASLLSALVPSVLVAQEGSTDFEKIFVSKFEETPVELAPRIEFTTDQSHIFADSGETRAVEVQVYDESGQLVADPQIDWSTEDSALLGVTPTGPNSAELESLDTWSGTVGYTATYTPLGLQATGLATMADTAPETVLIPSQWVLAVLGDRLEEHTIELTRNTTTEALQNGDILASGNAVGLMVRVLSSDLDTDRVAIQAEPALITAAFDTFNATATAEPVHVTFRATPESTQVTVRSAKTDEILQTRTIPDRGLLGSLDCDGGLEQGVNVDVTALELETTLTPTDTLLEVNGSGVALEFGVSGTMTATAEAAVDVTAGIDVQGECEIDLPNVSLGGVPLPPFSLGPRIAPALGVGIAASADANAGWVSLSGLERSWTVEAGVTYTDTAGWDHFSNFNATGTQANADTFTLDGQLALEANAGIDVGVGLDLCLGTCSFFTQLVGAEFLQASGGPFWRFGMATPLDPAGADYAGPELSIGVGADASAGLEVAFFDSGLLSYLPLEASAGISFPIFSEEFEFVSTPELSGGVTCSPDCNAMPANGGTVDVTLNAAAPGSGTAEFWVGQTAAGNLSLLGTAPFDAGQAADSLGVSGFGDGDYSIYPRLVLDDPLFWFTSTWPVGSTGALGGFTVDAGSTTAPNVVLNDTGIDWCADADTNNLDCPVAGFPGQDGDFGRDALARDGQLDKVGAGAAGFDFTKLDANGNDLPASATTWFCVRDNHTGLIWEVKTDDGGLRDKDHTYTWYNPDSSTNGGDPGVQDGGACIGSSCDTTGFSQAVNAQGLCGASDWRVPSLDELFSIVHHGRTSPAIDTGYFPNVSSSFFWSASPGAGDSGSAWLVFFFDGRGGRSFMSLGRRVRLVRGGQ